MRGANSELVYHERQCWYSDYTIFRCQREFRLHTLAGLGASGARTDSPMAFKLHILPTDPLVWSVTDFHMHPLTVRSLIVAYVGTKCAEQCRVSNKAEAIFTFLCLIAMFSVFIDFRMASCRGYGGQRVSWWQVGAAINELLT